MAVTTAALANTELARLRKIRGVVSRRAPHSDRLQVNNGQHNIFVRDYRRSPENEGLNDAQSDNIQPGHWSLYEPAINGPGEYSRSDLIWA
jgi:hypothetical protein